MTGQTTLRMTRPALPEDNVVEGRARPGRTNFVFKCFCGLSFSEREPFDAHLQSTHPGSFSECKDCGRVLPKGQWRVEAGVFHLEGAGEEAARA